MITNRNILCISTPPWESDYASTTVQLMRELSRHNKVLFVNNPFTMKDVLDGLQKKKKVPVKKVFGFKKRLKIIPLENGSEAYVLTPPMVLTTQFLPNGWLYRTLTRWNGQLLLRTVKKQLKQLHMQQDLINVVAFNPTLGLEVGRKFGESLLLYLCYDEISAAPHLKKHGVWQEQAFAKMVDAIIVTSQGLFERKKLLAKHCFIVKNAADFPLFSSGFNTVIPQKKQVGFIGGIDRRLDYPLMEHLIRSLPDVEFIFIGRILYNTGAELLKKLKNVVIVGPKPLTELPAYVKNFSVGIIPFKRSDSLKNVYPLKLNEYLAAGIPVVTTNFSYLDEFKDIVSIAATTEAFTTYVIHEMQNDTLEKRRARQEVARLNSWAHRAEEFSDVITQLEQQKHAKA